MSEPLYKIAHDVLVAMDRNMDETGLDDFLPEAAPDIDALFESFDKKVEACAAAMREYEARASAAAEEAERLYDRKVAAMRRRDWLKEYIRSNMEVVGRQKVEGDLFTIRVQATPASVVVDDVAALDAKYTVIKTTVAADKGKIKEALLAGAEIPGASLVRGTTVVIR